MSKLKDPFAKRFVVEPGKRLNPSKRDPDDTGGVADKSDYEEVLQQDLKRLFDQQMLLSAGKKRALLIVLQGMDTAGKDGTIKHVMTGLNPQACRVTAFKVPTEEELHHDFLWRAHRAVPQLGEIGIFNRSHYEDVLVARVHHLVPKPVWSTRYDQINAFEKILAKNHVAILKFFLHISKDEQARRLEQRIDDPQRNWKLSPADLAERKYWDDYMEAYEDALTQCSTERAPWYVIPANKKWFRNFLVAELVVRALDRMRLKYPPPSVDVSKVILD